MKVIARITCQFRVCSAPIGLRRNLFRRICCASDVFHHKDNESIEFASIIIHRQMHTKWVKCASINQMQRTVLIFKLKTCKNIFVVNCVCGWMFGLLVYTDAISVYWWWVSLPFGPHWNVNRIGTRAHQIEFIHRLRCDWRWIHIFNRFLSQWNIISPQSCHHSSTRANGQHRTHPKIHIFILFAVSVRPSIRWSEWMYK